MPYIPNTWQDLPSTTTPISAERLANLETQYIEAVTDAAIDATVKADTAQAAATGYTDTRLTAEVTARNTAILTSVDAEAAARSAQILSTWENEETFRLAGDAASVATAASDATAKVLVETNRAIAAEATKVNLTGAETIAGVKTFTSAPVVPDASFAVAKTSGLQAALDTKEVPAGAQAKADAAQAFAIQRVNHTGTQSADTLTDGTTNKAFLATERTKLAGVATGATANDTDANLKARANHTGTQLASTISDFSTAADARVAAATDIVRTSGAQTVAGVKTFSSAPVVPDSSFAQAKVTNLVTDLAALTPRTGSRPAGQGEVTLNAEDYGLIGDGVADDTVAFTALYAAAAAKSKGASVFGAVTSIKFRSGRYIDSLPRVFSFRVVLEGEGRDNTIIYRKAGATGDFLTFDVSYSGISSMTIDGNKNNNPSGGDNVVLNAYRTFIELAVITKAKGNNITIGKTAPALGHILHGLGVSLAGGYGIQTVTASGSTDGMWSLLDVGQNGKSGVRLDQGAQNILALHAWGNGIEDATENHGVHVNSSSNVIVASQSETNLGNGLYVSGAASRSNDIDIKTWGNILSGMRIFSAPRGRLRGITYRNGVGNTTGTSSTSFAGVLNDSGTDWIISVTSFDDTNAVVAGDYVTAPAYPFPGRAAGGAYTQTYGYAEIGTADGNLLTGCKMKASDHKTNALIIVGNSNRIPSGANDFGAVSVPIRSISAGAVRAPSDADYIDVATSSTDITSVLGHYTGRRVTIRFTAATPGVVVHSAALRLSGAVDWTPLQYATLTLISDGTNWHETARSYSGTQAQSTVTNLVSDLAAKVPSTRLVSAGVGLSGGGALSGDQTLVAVNSSAASNWGMVAQTLPPSSCASSSALASGTVYVFRVIAEDSAASAVRTVRFYQVTASSALTLGKVAVFDSSGAKLGSDSADQSATWNGGGSSGRSATVGTFALTKGTAYYVAVLAVGTTGPAVSRAGNNGAVNINLSGASLIWSTNGTGATDMPASITPSSNASSSSAFWVGLF